MKIFANFKLFDEKHRRVSIFGCVIEGSNEIRITVIPCSKKDMFSRKTGWNIFSRITMLDYKLSGYGTCTIMVSKEHSKKDFLNWCNSNFYKRMEVYPPKQPMYHYYKPNEFPDLIKSVGKLYYL